MNDQLPTIPSAGSVGSFISQREKGWGNFGVIVILALLILGFYAVAPHIIILLNLALTIVSKTILLGVLTALAAFLWFMLSSKKFHALLWYWRAIFYRKFTMLMVKSSPLDIIYAYVNEYLNEKLETIQTAADRVYGVRNEIKQNMENYKAQIKERIQQADALKSRYYKNEQWIDEDKRFLFQKISSEAGMLQSNFEKSQRRFERTEKYCEIMKKMQQAFEFYRDKTKFFADTLSADYKEAQAMAKATQATSSVLGGDPRSDIYEMSVKYVQGQISLMTGQVDRFMQVAPQFLADPELNTMTSEDAMMKTLDQWDKASDQLLEQADNIGKAGKAMNDGDKQAAYNIVKSGDSRELVPVLANRPDGTVKKKYNW